MLEIQKGVPIPPKNSGPANRQRKYPYDELQPGEMFFVPGAKWKNIQSSVSAAKKRLQRRFVGRKTMGPDPATGEMVEGIGIWRDK